MPQPSDLYSYKAGSSRDEEMSFYSMRGRISVLLFWERILLIITICMSINLFIELVLSTRRELFQLVILGFTVDLLPVLRKLTIIFSIHTIIIQIVKRAHDCNVRGFMAIINPLIFIKRGTRGNNDYGLDPIPQSKIEFFDEYQDSKRFKELQIRKKHGLTILTYLVSSALLLFVTVAYYDNQNSKSDSSLLFSFISGFLPDQQPIQKDVVTIDTCMIGDMTWMVGNLRVDTFSTGESILQAQSDYEWMHAVENEIPAWCYYDNDPRNDSLYGKLYNWYAVNDSRGLAPKGWHIASNQEWEQAAKLFGGVNEAGRSMKSSYGWKYDDKVINLSNFKAMPGGYRKAQDASFLYLGTYAYWWTSDSKNRKMAINRGMEYDEAVVNKGAYYKGGGFSVRCLLDGEMK